MGNLVLDDMKNMKLSILTAKGIISFTLIRISTFFFFFNFWNIAIKFYIKIFARDYYNFDVPNITFEPYCPF